MRIGLMGFDFMSSNKGCEALTYSFIEMLIRLANGNTLEIDNYTYNESLGELSYKYPLIKFRYCKINLKNLKFLKEAYRNIKRCHIFFDATFGDGFSDIYGKKWNLKTDTIKQLVLITGTPLVLLPQTYGPYESKFLEKWAIHIIKNATAVYSRDALSAQFIKEICGYDVNVATDMAFTLPFNRSLYSIQDKKIKVGINISSLLWAGKWAEENRFGLTVDYVKYHRLLMDLLLEKGSYSIYIIPHVIDLNNFNVEENDYRVCKQIQNEYGDRVVNAPAFSDPIEAKSYIANMDVFIGSRMHATIGAISSGVATIPFSYSRKFEGLYGNLQYPYVLSAKKIETDDALRTTMKWIENKENLKIAGIISTSLATKILKNFEIEIKEIMKL
ncbi:MAG TPA: polysaccharide pyruvyl transferase family protein [Firmicutes bacterium]|jgi:colanic acid/amylovoran biosynthesis protein|nr:polysaccharide pyruvyl transferase family protein [Bacillota bacterium]